MPRPVTLSFAEKAHLYWILLRACGSALVQLCTAPFRDRTPPNDTLLKYIALPPLRVINDGMTIRQQHFASPPTDEAYIKYCNDTHTEIQTTDLPEGGKGHWLGNKNASKVIIYFHGGGYALPGDYKFFPVLAELISTVKSQGTDVAVAFLSYTVSPYARYPTQIKQGLHLLQHILTVQGKRPENVVLAGDSAGGNLALGILSHALHPHPSGTFPTVKLSAPLAGAALLSPWVSFRSDFPSFQTNKDMDSITVTGLDQWSQAYLGPDKPIAANRDAYVEAHRAPSNWWDGLEKVVKRVLIIAASAELMADPIKEVGAALEVKHPAVQNLVVAGAHDDLLVDAILGVPKGEVVRLLESFSAQCLA